MKQLLYLFISISLLATSGCTKEGIKGEQGEAGTDGNANVHNHSFTIVEWEWMVDENYYRAYSNIEYYLTPEVISSAALLPYIKTGSFWTSLPLTYSLGAPSVELYRPYFSENTFEIRVSRTDGSGVWYPQIEASADNPREIRLVVIPVSGMITNLDHSDFEAVKTAYGLED